MQSPQFKGENLSIVNERALPLYELRKVNVRSLISLIVSRFLLFTGFVLIILNNLNILSPGSYFGAPNWVTITVFSIGLIINCVSIPYLYFSSYQNFRIDNEYWDKETFWILPLFFFGTFYLYGSEIRDALILLVVSVLFIWGIHINFTWYAWKNMIKNSNCSLASKHEYFVTLKYLTIYYILLLGVMILFNPLQKIAELIRFSN